MVAGLVIGFLWGFLVHAWFADRSARLDAELRVLLRDRRES